MRKKRLIRRNKKQRKIIIICVCTLFLFMSAGYAAMQTNLGIKAKGNVVKKAITTSEFIESIPKVTEGDGLYSDSYEENMYTYRGANPNNYVTFNGETWRIISVNTTDNTIKIMRNEMLEDREFDTTNGRYQSSGYCNSSSSGCNIWGSNTTLYNSSMSPITTLGRTYNGTAYTLPSTEAPLNKFLNEDYYNGLNTTAQSMVKQDAVYKIGVLANSSGQTLNTDISQVSAAKWRGKVALIDATEYVRASTNSSCTNVYQGYQSSNPCKNNNWMYLNDIWWTISPYSNNNSYFVWSVYNYGSVGRLFNYLAYTSHGVRPVVTLSPEVKITAGDGSSGNPYILEI